MLADNAWLHVFYNAHHAVHHGICKIVSYNFFDEAFFYYCVGDGIGGSSAVGDDKSPRTQIHTAVIADDDNKNVREIMTVYLTKNWLASSRRRLTVVIGTENIACGSKHVSVATVACIIILFAIAGNDGHCLLLRLYVMRKSKKLATFFGVKAFGCFLFFYCKVFVFQITVDLYNFIPLPIGEGNER